MIGQWRPTVGSIIQGCLMPSGLSTTVWIHQSPRVALTIRASLGVTIKVWYWGLSLILQSFRKTVQWSQSGRKLLMLLSLSSLVHPFWLTSANSMTKANRRTVERMDHNLKVSSWNIWPISAKIVKAVQLNMLISLSVKQILSRHRIVIMTEVLSNSDFTMWGLSIKQMQVGRVQP